MISYANLAKVARGSDCWSIFGQERLLRLRSSLSTPGPGQAFARFGCAKQKALKRRLMRLRASRPRVRSALRYASIGAVSAPAIQLCMEGGSINATQYSTSSGSCQPRWSVGQGNRIIELRARSHWNVILSGLPQSVRWENRLAYAIGPPGTGQGSEESPSHSFRRAGRIFGMGFWLIKRGWY